MQAVYAHGGAHRKLLLTIPNPFKSDSKSKTKTRQPRNQWTWYVYMPAVGLAATTHTYTQQDRQRDACLTGCFGWGHTHLAFTCTFKPSHFLLAPDTFMCHLLAGVHVQVSKQEDWILGALLWLMADGKPSLIAQLYC